MQYYALLFRRYSRQCCYRILYSNGQTKLKQNTVQFRYAPAAVDVWRRCNGRLLKCHCDSQRRIMYTWNNKTWLATVFKGDYTVRRIWTSTLKEIIRNNTLWNAIIKNISDIAIFSVSRVNLLDWHHWRRPFLVTHCYVYSDHHAMFFSNS